MIHPLQSSTSMPMVTTKVSSWNCSRLSQWNVRSRKKNSRTAKPTSWPINCSMKRCSCSNAAWNVWLRLPIRWSNKFTNIRVRCMKTSWSLLRTVNVCIMFPATWKKLTKQKAKLSRKHSKNRSSCILSMKLGKNICVKWTNCVTRYKTPVTKIKIPCWSTS